MNIVYFKNFNESINNLDWTVLSPNQIEEYKDTLFKLVSNAYSTDNGHFGIMNPNDCSKYDFWEVMNIDSDDDIDILIFGKKTKWGIKRSGIGHDSTHFAKKEVLRRSAEQLKNGEIWSEMSSKLAYIMLNQYRCPFVSNKENVYKMFGINNIRWIGTHPENKTDKYVNGWYYRNIDGKWLLNIIIGNPIF